MLFWATSTPFLNFAVTSSHAKFGGDGDRNNERVPAVTFFDGDIDERFWHYQYIREILGWKFDPANGKPYIRVGYCPIAIEGKFAIAKSFLPPGFAKTPEYEAIKNSDNTYLEKKRLKELATDEMAYTRLLENNDFSAIRCFHENGVPQVVQTDEKWYHPHEIYSVQPRKNPGRIVRGIQKPHSKSNESEP